MDENIGPLQYHTSRIPLASPFNSPPSLTAEVGYGSEAALNQGSPENFTQNHVTSNYFIGYTNPSISAEPFILDNNSFLAAYGDFTTTSERHLFLVAAHKKTNSLPSMHQQNRDSPLAPHSRLAIDLGLHKVPYNSEIPLTATDDDSPRILSHSGSAADPDSKSIPYPAIREHPGDTDQNMAASLKNSHSSSDEDSPRHKYNAGSTNDQSPWGSPPQPFRNASELHHLSTANRTNSPHSTDDSISPHGSNHSERRIPAYPLTMPTSTSYPSLTTFKKPARPLTTLQMVNETTYRSSLPSVQVTLERGNSRGKVVESIDYRDQSWQGRSDEHKGWTPYVNFADFPKVQELLQNMRESPEDHMPDTATIFTGIEQVHEWRENQRLKNSHKYKVLEEDDIPETKEEKAAVVKLLFKAFKSTVDGQSNKNVQDLFDHQVHSNAQVEAVCWQLLEAAIQRSKGGPLTHAYEPEKASKSATDMNSGFAERIDDLIVALMREKSVCCALLKTPKVMDTVDFPSYIGKRTANNRDLNRKKAVVAKLGKQKLMELHGEQGKHSQRGGRAVRGSSNKAKRTKDEFDDSDSAEESPFKRHSPERSDYSTPGQRQSALKSTFSAYTPSSSQIATQNSTPGVDSPTPSTTGSLRERVTGFDFGGISQPNFGQAQTSRSIPQSPLCQSVSLDGMGAQMLQSPLFDSEFQNSFQAVNDDGGDEEFFG